MENEKKKEEGKEQEKPEENAPSKPDEGEQPAAEKTIVDKANESADRLEKANEVKKELLDREEALEAKKILGGRASAGQAAKPPKTEDEKWAEDAKKRYAGTGMDPTPDETPTTYG